MAETAVFEQDFSLPVGAAPTPIPGSYEFIYLRSASADVIQVSANGQTWSDLPVGLMFPLTGLRKGGDIGPREPLIRAKGGVAVTGTVVVCVGNIQDFSLILGSDSAIGLKGLTPLGANRNATVDQANRLATGGLSGVPFSLSSVHGISGTNNGLNVIGALNNPTGSGKRVLIRSIRQNVKPIIQGAATVNAGTYTEWKVQKYTGIATLAAGQDVTASIKSDFIGTASVCGFFRNSGANAPTASAGASSTIYRTGTDFVLGNVWNTGGPQDIYIPPGFFLEPNESVIIGMGYQLSAVDIVSHSYTVYWEELAQ